MQPYRPASSFASVGRFIFISLAAKQMKETWGAGFVPKGVLEKKKTLEEAVREELPEPFRIRESRPLVEVLERKYGEGQYKWLIMFSKNNSTMTL
ncbi:hypothetical protein LTR37_001414 [Vermiconidia calcicola]|uniref:Uncharacterized protein n=1 Tax=Vermiconidia calcicola TaxID=1690605 RepID=A0ACC3NW23_9PEZI|nr:hypothetical protein LTR37_001414 [Vermiconidia calcicola]